MASRQKLISGTGDTAVTVYGDPVKLAAVCGGFTPAADQPISNQQFNRSGFSARQYPGDTTPISRGAAQVERVKAPTGIGNILPGRPFTVEVTTGTGPSKVVDVTQFTFTGPFKNLHAKFVSSATKALVLRSPGGKPYLIADPTP
jgi:hypothetical protein